MTPAERRAYTLAWRARNREAHLASRRKWRAKNRAKINEAKRAAYHEANPEAPYRPGTGGRRNHILVARETSVSELRESGLSMEDFL
jgi:hypothetical protein